MRSRSSSSPAPRPTRCASSSCAAPAATRRAAPLNRVEAMSWLKELVSEARAFIAETGAVPLPNAQDESVLVAAMPDVLGASGGHAVLLPPQRRAPRQVSQLLVY